MLPIVRLIGGIAIILLLDIWYHRQIMSCSDVKDVEVSSKCLGRMIATVVNSCLMIVLALSAFTMWNWLTFIYAVTAIPFVIIVVYLEYKPNQKSKNWAYVLMGISTLNWVLSIYYFNFIGIPTI